MDDEFNGIIKEKSHPRAIELVKHDFFWDYLDELAPFGSDEGHNALVQFRNWRLENPSSSLVDFLTLLIDAIAEIDVLEYNDSLAQTSYIQKQLENDDFDDDYYIYTMDAYLIGAGFGQLADEGVIDKEAKPIIATALLRQINWASLDENEINQEYIKNITALQDILQTA